MAAERQMVDTFIKMRGRKPEKAQDWAEVMRMAYPTNDLPNELRGTEAASLYSAGFGRQDTPPAPTLTRPTAPQPVAQGPVAPAPAYTGSDPYIRSLADREASAMAGLDAAQKRTQDIPEYGAGEALRVLQEAIRMRAAPRDFAQAPIGESQTFREAGVGGFGALAQSLQERGQEIEANHATFLNTIQQMSGAYKTAASRASDDYAKAVEQYRISSTMLSNAMEQLRRNEQEMKLLQTRSQLDKELENLRFENDRKLKGTASPSDLISAADKGLIYRNGEFVPDNDLNRGIVGGFDISRYATDPNHEKAVASIVQSIGKFDTLQDVDAYIRKVAPGSPVTAEMVSKASEKYGVPWEMLVAMMQQDSSLGTKGYGARTMNPGNVGTTDERAAAGKPNSFGSWQEGVDAVASWLSKHRAPEKPKQSDKFTEQFYSTPEGQKARDDERAMLSMFLGNAIVKDFNAVQSQKNEMEKVVKSGIQGPGDLYLVYSFMKGLDPTSVVRDTEYQAAAKSGNIFQGAFAKYNGYLKDGGGFLPDNVKKDFLSLVQGKYQVKEQEFDNFKKGLEESARSQGINPKNVTLNLKLMSEGSGLNVIKAPDGSEWVKEGNTMKRVK